MVRRRPPCGPWAFDAAGRWIAVAVDEDGVLRDADHFDLVYRGHALFPEEREWLAARWGAGAGQAWGQGRVPLERERRTAVVRDSRR